MRNIYHGIILTLTITSLAYSYTITSFAQTQLVASGVAPNTTDIANFDSLVGTTGGIVEDFEDNTLIAGLSLTFQGNTNALPSSFRNSNSVLAKNFWDGADSVVVNASSDAIFSYAPGASFFAIGLGDVESDLRIVVPGQDLGLVRSLPNYQRILDNAREVYIRIDQQSGDSAITEVRFTNGQSGDGIFYDHLVVANATVPEPASYIFAFLALAFLWRKNR